MTISVRYRPTDDLLLREADDSRSTISDPTLSAATGHEDSTPGYDLGRTRATLHSDDVYGRRRDGEKDRQAARQPAVQLHTILTTLVGASKLDQRDGLLKALKADQDGASFYARLADLYQMPDYVKAALESANADPIFLEWYPPIAAVISTLDGTSDTNLGRFAPPTLTEPMVKLYMCRTVLPGDLEIAQLIDIRTSITEAISQVSTASDIELTLQARLLDIRHDAMNALREAEVFGIDVAKRKLDTVMRQCDGKPSSCSKNGQRRPDLDNCQKCL